LFARADRISKSPLSQHSRLAQVFATKFTLDLSLVVQRNESLGSTKYSEKQLLKVALVGNKDYKEN